MSRNTYYQRTLSGNELVVVGQLLAIVDGLTETVSGQLDAVDQLLAQLPADFNTKWPREKILDALEVLGDFATRGTSLPE